jgi:hypothetical protein
MCGTSERSCLILVRIVMGRRRDEGKGGRALKLRHRPVSIRRDFLFKGLTTLDSVVSMYFV